MGRLSCIALLFLSLAAAWLLLLTGGGIESHGPSRAASPETYGANTGVQRYAVPEGSRREVITASDKDLPEGEVQASTTGRLVRVHGLVLRDGRPAANYDLVFQTMGFGPDNEEEDWDFTDENGRYEVELPPACYVVRNDDEGPWLANVVVPKGKDELVLNIDLPLGW